MKRDDYMRDPCGASSLPYWKTNSVSLPPFISVIRDDRFTGAGGGVRDVKYFKLIHHLRVLPSFALPEGFALVDADESAFAAHIARCYDREGVLAKELRQYKRRRVYAPDLWIAVQDSVRGTIAATGIGEMDRDIGEGVLEWIQVSPEYRGRGLGRFLVSTLLKRMREQADFATVSGRTDNRWNPMALYLACGFQDPVIWHVMQKEQGSEPDIRA